MNFVHIAGHLGADPEVRFTSSGKKVTTLRVACRTRKKGQDDTIWWRVTIWDENFANMIPHLKKGSPVMASGEIQKPEIFNDREGRPQISMDMVATHLQFSPFGKPDGTASNQPQVAHAAPANSLGSASESSAPVNPYMRAPVASAGQTYDDEVPF